MDIHVGMMLKFPMGNLLGWIVDDTPIFHSEMHGELITYKVQWANGTVTQEVIRNITKYRNNWLELEISHERLSNNDTDR
jgi:hypothetical protein